MSENLVSDLLQRVNAGPDDPLLRRATAEGDGWADVTASQFLGEVRAVAGGLRARGVTPGERVLLFAQTCYEWTLLDYAIWYAGGVTVPAYPSTGAGELAAMISDAEPVLAISDTTDRMRVANVASPELPVVALDVGLPDLMRAPATFPPVIEPDAPATLIYTPGTTGDPRGCALSHRALLSSAVALTTALSEVFSPTARTVILLPLAHVFARELQIACVHAGVVFAHGRGLARLEEDLKATQPSFLVGVPRLFERLYTRASQQAAVEGRGRTFDNATEIAISYSKSIEGDGPGLRLRTLRAVHDRLVYARLRDSLGGACRVALCGGAPLGDQLGHFFRGIGVPILEGYVLTEAAGVAAINRPRAHRVGTVGTPLPGVETRVDEDGELLVRGEQVLTGYWRDESATAAALRDGWLHTGDLVERAPHGNLTVLGRKREVIVTAGGKHIVPTVLEDRIRAHPLVDQVVVVGDGQPFAAALVTIDPAGFAAWQARTGKSGDLSALADDADLRGAVTVAIEQANRTVSPAEAVRRFVVLPVRWTEDGGQLTPNLKLRRNAVVRQHRAEIEALFGF